MHNKNENFASKSPRRTGLDRGRGRCYNGTRIEKTKRREPENGGQVAFRELSGGARQRRASTLLAGERAGPNAQE